MPSRWNRDRWDDFGGGFPAYVSAAERRRQAEREIAALRKKGRAVTPVAVVGAKIAKTFWGKAWCDNLESYSDYENRLPRGRTYVRSGAIIHLGIKGGKIEALVRGTTTYSVELAVKPLTSARWAAVVDECAGQVASLLELLGGKLASGVMQIVTHRTRGIFPSPREINLSCTCPDAATMCKHVAAAMYGVGARLDDQPELLFRLRGVDPGELVAKSVGRAAKKATPPRAKALAAAALSDIFGIELDDEGASGFGADGKRNEPDEPARPKTRKRGVRKTRR